MKLPAANPRLLCVLLLLHWGTLLFGGPSFAIIAEDDASRRFCEQLLAEQSGNHTFLEREELENILRERRLQQSELGGQAVLERFTAADLLVIVEKGQAGKKEAGYPSRLIIFDQASGFRLLTRSLPQKSDDALAEAGSALRDVLRHSADPGSRRYLSLVAIRNNGVRPEFRSELDSIAARLELELQYLPGTTLLEREFLNRRQTEEKLAGTERKLPVSRTLVRLEFTPVHGSIPGYTTTLRLTDTADRVLFTRTFEGKERSNAQAVRQAIEEFMKLPPPEKVPDAKEEARRYYNEFFYLKHYGDPRAAMRRAYAAIALDPDKVLYRVWALDTLRSEAAKNATPEERFGLVKEAAALQDNNQESAYFCNFAAITITDLLEGLFRNRELPSDLREEIRQWLAERRPRLFPHLQEKPLKAPPANEQEFIHYTEGFAMRCSPSLYFDRKAFLDALKPEIEQLLIYAEPYPSAPVYRKLRWMGGLWSTHLENAKAAEKTAFRELAGRLSNSGQCYLKAFGLTLALRLERSYSSSITESARSAYVDRLFQLPPAGFENGGYRDLFASLLTYGEQEQISRMIRDRQALLLKPDDPRSPANASPEALFRLLQRENTGALEMHGEKWAQPLAEQFWQKGPAELQAVNPEYRITPIETTWPSRRTASDGIRNDSNFPAPRPWYSQALLASAVDGGKGYLLRKLGRTGPFSLEEWNAETRTLKMIRRFEQPELHFTRTFPGFADAALAASGNYLLIGTADQIVVVNTESGETRTLTAFVTGRVHSLAFHDGRIYAFLGAGEDYGAEFSRLVSCLPDGKDVRTHISTQRDVPANELEDVSKPYYVWGIGLAGNRIFFPAITNGYGMAAFWEFDLAAVKPRKLWHLAEGRRALMESGRADNFLRQNGKYLDFSIYGNVLRGDRTPPVALFFRLNMESGESEIIGWGEEKALKPFNLKHAWGEYRNFSGPFHIENGNFWCAGGKDKYAMMTHLRLDAPEKSPRLIFPKVRALLPGSTPDSVVAVNDDWMAEIRYTGGNAQ
ncbi:MAG: hypothetical protein HPZ91_15765 [Lentisphaeria bacterium]|nr:hypothetical protein [Lentisphaeria bacterium]